MELSSIRSRKAPQEIVYRIRGQILAGLLERGSKLPSEQELMHTFNVSRQTLREALRVLEVQGLLEIRAGSGGGAFVAGASTQAPPDRPDQRVRRVYARRASRKCARYGHARFPEL